MPYYWLYYFAPLALAFAEKNPAVALVALVFVAARPWLPDPVALSVYDGVHKILNPEPVHSPWVDYGVLALSAVLEGFSLRTGVREANRSRRCNKW